MVRLSFVVLAKNHRNFIDSVRISCHGGRGGNGLPKYGGVGGKGGDVFVEAKEGYSLKRMKQEFPKQRFVGEPGGNSRRFQILGSSGKDTILYCPAGVTAENQNCIIGEVNKVGERILLARGGCGGGPQNGFLGQKGQHVNLTLDLKVLADIGFVGYPNAGKSTLLGAISKARPKTANYPFTTIAPSLGVLEYKDFRKVTAADLPGLIEGAHMNYGMGHKFLKHCIRTKVLLFVVDIEGFRLNPNTPHRNAFENVMYLHKELELYDDELLLKPAMLAVNKMDMDPDEAKFKKLCDDLKFYERNISDLPNDIKPKSVIKFDAIVPISAKNGTNISLLKDKMRTVIDIYQEKRLVRYETYEEEEVVYA